VSWHSCKEASVELDTFDGFVLDDWYKPLILTAALHASSSTGDSALIETCSAQLADSTRLLAAAGSGGITLGPVLFALARCAHILGERATAGRHLDSALEMIERLDARPWKARALRGRFAKLEADAFAGVAVDTSDLRAPAQH